MHPSLIKINSMLARTRAADAALIRVYAESAKPTYIMICSPVSPYLNYMFLTMS